MSDKPEDEKKEETTESKEPELPPEVDAFFKGKNKYKHPYGDWKPVTKVEPLKRKTFVDQLDLPEDNWHLPQNQLEPVIKETKDESEVKLIFKEREITSISSRPSDSVAFKKPKLNSNRQLRGSKNDDNHRKASSNES